MKSLSDLLLNYHLPGIRFSETRRICAEEATALTGCALTSKQMHFKNEELSCSVPPIVKSALLLKQQELIEKLAARGVVVRSLR